MMDFKDGFAEIRGPEGAPALRQIASHGSVLDPVAIATDGQDVVTDQQTKNRKNEK
jgi:hypothetical protein